MGDHSQDAIWSALQYEQDAEDFLDGEMDYDEAMDHGFIGPGSEHNDALFKVADSRGPMSLDTINSELAFYEAGLGNPDSIRQRILPVEVVNSNLPHIRAEVSIKQKAEFPTCNCCKQSMKPRMGKYGKFYYCECPDQKCVSDEYWQKVRR